MSNNQPVIVYVQQRGFFERALRGFVKSIFILAILGFALWAVYMGTKGMPPQPTTSHPSEVQP